MFRLSLMRLERLCRSIHTAAFLMLLAAVVSAASQAPPKAVSTSSGVYTSSQAARGEQTYMNICVSCHPAGTYSTPTFREKWNGALLSDLFGLVSTTMPKLEPGSLEPDESAQVIAYLLKINSAPPSRTTCSSTSRTTSARCAAWPNWSARVDGSS